MSRKPPPKVAPVVLDGVRYEQVMNGTSLGLEQAAGVLRAVDLRSGKVRWVKQVYAITMREEVERDVQNVYFRSMVFEDGAIVIENENGKRFRVDPASGDSTPLP